MSATLVFDAPRHARAVFDAVVRDNLAIRRPDHIEMIFTGRHGGPAVPVANPTATGSRPAS